MKNGFGLKYLHKFLNVPFLQLQVSRAPGQSGATRFSGALWLGNQATLLTPEKAVQQLTWGTGSS